MPILQRSLPYQNIERARQLVLRFGWNATAFQVVNPGICHWFTPDNEALVGYVTRQRVRIVAGAPVCDETRLADVIAAFEADAATNREKVCYFGAAGRVMHLLGGKQNYATIVLGAQPVWNPGDWASCQQGHASLRAQLARARNKGVCVNEWPIEVAHDHPELWRLLHEWLATRALPPLQFLVEPETLSRLQGRRIFVASRDGQPVGFVNCSPIPARNGWLIEQFVRGKAAPNGTIELLLDTAIRQLTEDGAEYMTLGLVPLSRNTWEPQNYNPLWLRLVLMWIRAHGRRFYNFDGLDRFKAKFRPQAWEPIYAISNEAYFSPRTLYAIADAFSPGSPIRVVVAGLGRALRQEGRWLRARYSRGKQER